MYEMLLGRGPFADRTPAQQMAAHATTPPPALRAQRQELPEALETLVMQCLAKDPSARPQSALEALTTLQSLGTVTSGSSAPIPRKRTGLKVAAAMVLVAVAGASFALPRLRGPSAPAMIADSAKVDVILLPAIHEPADSLLAQGAMETFKSTLANEPRIFGADLRDGVPTPAAMLPTNGTITRDSILRWIPDLGARAHLTLSIARAGTGFVISTVVKAAATDSTLLNAQDAAKSGVEVPRIVAEHAEAAKRALASRFGTLERPTPNGRFWLTTPTAVQSLNDGARAAQSGDAASATSFFRAAVRADSNFALGWYVLHSHFSSLGIRPDERLRAIAAAYRHREQARILALRLEIEARYLRAQGDDSAAAAVLERMERELGDVGAGPTLAAIFVSQRRFEDALRRYANARDTTYIQPSAPNAFYIFTLLDLKREDEARAEYARLEAGTGPSHPNTRAARFAFWRYHRQTDSVAFYAAKELEGARDGIARNFANVQLVNALPTLGRLREWEETITRREQRFNDIDAAPSAVSAQLDRALMVMFLTQDTARAGALVDEALERAPLEKMAPMDRPYVSVIQTLGAIGRIAEARRYSAEADRDIPLEFRRIFSRSLAGARVELEIAAGDAAAAMREARLADIGACAECRAIDYARAFDIQGNVDSALVYYDRFLDAKSIRLAFWDATFRANALRRAGALREQQGDIPGALARYREFVELWRNADPELQDQVREVQARITRLQGPVG
jgi:tetratricopeptide (TPR) repeat protein